MSHHQPPPISPSLHGKRGLVVGIANESSSCCMQGSAGNAVRYTAAERGRKQIRANSTSPGPIGTRAASGIAHFDELLAAEAAVAPGHQLPNIEDVGAMAPFLVSARACQNTGTIILVDSGRHLMA